jgi:hypothetical protein
MGRHEGLCEVKGDHIPLVVQVVGNIVEPGFGGVWRVDSQKGWISLWNYGLSSWVACC